MLRSLFTPLLFAAPVLILGLLSLRLYQNEKTTIEASYRKQAQTWTQQTHQNLLEPTRVDDAVALSIPYPIIPPSNEHPLALTFREASQLPPEQALRALNSLLLDPAITDLYTPSGQHLPTLISHQLLKLNPLPTTTDTFLRNLSRHPTELTPLLLKKSTPLLQEPDSQLLEKITTQIPFYEKLRSMPTPYPNGLVPNWLSQQDRTLFTSQGVNIVPFHALTQEIEKRIAQNPPPEWLAYQWEDELSGARHVYSQTTALTPSNKFNYKQAYLTKSGNGFSIITFENTQYLQIETDRRLSRLKLILLSTTLLTALASTIAYLTLRKQQQLTALQSDFVASVSHELRTPIASIRLLAERLEKEDSLPQKKSDQYHRLISHESLRLGNLVENILDFSRIEKGHKLYHFEPTDLQALLTETLQLIQPNLEQKKHTLTTNLDLPAGYAPTLDPLAIRQLLINLFDNAIKFTPSPGTITLSATTVSTTTQLVIADTGPGIPESDRTKVFQRFYRRDRNTEVTGTGIGLSLVHHIVQAHQGTITITDNPNHKTGTQVTIDLPLDKKTNN